MSLFTATLLLLACSNVQPEYSWANISFAKAQKTAGDKLIMLDFFTEGCSWCKRLDADVFPNQAVQDFARQNMVSLKIDAEKGIGPELRDRYKIPGYPTIVFIKADGSEVDRIVGYRPVEIFLEELDRINRNEGTVDDLVAKLEKSPNDGELLYSLATKYEDRQDDRNALTNWERLYQTGGEKAELAHYKIAENTTRIENSPAPLVIFIAKNKQSQFVDDAFVNLQRFYRATKDTISEIKTYVQFMGHLEETGTETATALNGYAWRMTQLGQNLGDALEKIRKAVKLAADETPDVIAGLIDTEAEVLWKLGRIDEAVERIDKCIELQPEDQYFKDQREKFLPTQELPT